MRRTKEDALLTRELLLDAAELVFSDKGVSRTSLQDIAQAAGMTRGAIYWHFKDKASLFNAMMDRSTSPIEETIGRVGQEATDDPLAQVRAAMMDALTRIATEPRTRRVIGIAVNKVEYVDELSDVRARHISVHLNCQAHLEKALKRAQKLGLVASQPSARVMTVGLQALVGGLINTWMLDDKLFHLTRTGAQAIDLYLSGLKATSPSLVSSRLTSSSRCRVSAQPSRLKPSGL
ncbi:MAG: TetR family transcriptional regulator [Leptothrix sp. (in: Bacteria)]|nr:TetR family transcriptional regulator [Leptothrix sp. (in: b-proteobacteria)]